MLARAAVMGLNGKTRVWKQGFMKPENKDEHYMSLALREAEAAEAAGDTPIGAVIVKDGNILGRAHNQVELLRDPTAHAEIIAITQAAAALGDWRLSGATLYVTKEPCAMCAAAIRLARISRVVFGAAEPPGPAGDETPAEITGGVMAEECRALLQRFFLTLRSARRNEGPAAN